MNNTTLDPRETKRLNAYEDIKNMVEKNMSLGDMVVADNICVEHYRGVSLKDLATKYQKTVDEIKGILKNAGVKINEEETV